MLFTLISCFYLMQLQGEKKLEAWFISPASREYFSVEPVTFQYVTNSQKIYLPVNNEVLLNLFSFS